MNLPGPGQGDSILRKTDRFFLGIAIEFDPDPDSDSDKGENPSGLKNRIVLGS